MQKSIVSKEYGLFLAYLRKVRLEAGLTQVQLAKKLKVGQSAISKVEKGERRIDIVELRQWTRALGTSLIAFVTGFEDYIKKDGKEILKRAVAKNEVTKTDKAE